MNKGKWSVVYPSGHARIEKYFKVPLEGDVFVRLYKCPSGQMRLQWSGSYVGFNSIDIDDEDKVKADFPFIDTYER